MDNVPTAVSKQQEMFEASHKRERSVIDQATCGETSVLVASDPAARYERTCTHNVCQNGQDRVCHDDANVSP